jgi:hypothetical protein
VGVSKVGHAAAVSLPFIVGFIWQVVEPADSPFSHNYLSDRPGNRAVIRHPEDQTLFPVEHTHCESLLVSDAKRPEDNILEQIGLPRRQQSFGVGECNLSDVIALSSGCGNDVNAFTKTTTAISYSRASA